MAQTAEKNIVLSRGLGWKIDGTYPAGYLTGLALRVKFTSLDDGAVVWEVTKANSPTIITDNGNILEIRIADATAGENSGTPAFSALTKERYGYAIETGAGNAMRRLQGIATIAPASGPVDALSTQDFDVTFSDGVAVTFTGLTTDQLEALITGAGAETTPVSGDLVPIVVAGVLKKLDVADFPGGVPAAHALGGAEHTASTLADVNSKVSDATLDDASDPRPPRLALTNALVGATYILLPGDAGGLVISATGGTAITVNASSAATNDIFWLRQGGAGVLSLVADGVTINGPTATVAQFDVLILMAQSATLFHAYYVPRNIMRVGVYDPAGIGEQVVGLAAVQAMTGQKTFTEATLTDAANIAWNLNTAQAAKVTLAGNRTLDNPTNMKAGGTYILRVIQDGAGSRTLAYGAAYKWPGGTAPTLSTGGGAVDILTFLSDGTSMFGVAQLNFS